jgi:hypothetical protein
VKNVTSEEIIRRAKQAQIHGYRLSENSASTRKCELLSAWNLVAQPTGDELAIELEWTGTLAVPVMNLPAGSEMNAFVAVFLTFRDGRIASQRNYDCYPPFGPQADPAVPA